MQILLNGVPREVSPPLTIADLIAAAGLPTRGIAVALDGQVVPRAEHTTTEVAEGARIEIVTAVQGG